MKRFRYLVAAALLATPALSTVAFAETVEISVMLVNDIDKLDETERGGFARLAGAANAERKARENFVLVHAGDSISPSLLSGIDQGAHVVDLLNQAGIDVFVPGNHEFDFGPDVFKQRMSEATFDKVASNLREADGTMIDGFLDQKILEFGPVKVGFVGLTGEDAQEKSSPGDLTFAGAVETLEAKAEALRGEGADIIVAVSHTDRRTDRELADSGAADLVLSGDDHDLLLSYDGKVVLAEGREQGEFLPVIDLNVGVEGEGAEREVEWTPSFRIIDTARVEPDAATAEKVASYEAELDEELNVEIGSTSVDLDSRRATVRSQETGFGNLVADAMREASGADVAITNGGGIRGDRTYDAGTKLTRRDVLSELPFGNKTVVVELTGEQLRRAVEHGLSAVEDGSGRFPHLSGMRVTADLTKPAGERVTAIEVGGEALDDGETYEVATNDFMARGGDGYDSLAEGRPVVDATTGDLMANDVMAYIRERGEVSPGVEGRVETE